MLSKITKYLKCPVCIEGFMEFSNGATFEDFNNRFDLEDVENLINGSIGQYLVFKCSSCGAIERFNFKNIDEIVRREISKKIITLRAKKELEKSINVKIKYFVYCGVCNGYDSNGSCPPGIYNECSLRKAPHVI